LAGSIESRTSTYGYLTILSGGINLTKSSFYLTDFTAFPGRYSGIISDNLLTQELIYAQFEIAVFPVRFNNKLPD
jgi:hypothetical protein